MLSDVQVQTIKFPGKGCGGAESGLMSNLIVLLLTGQQGQGELSLSEQEHLKYNRSILREAKSVLKKSLN